MSINKLEKAAEAAGLAMVTEDDFDMQAPQKANGEVPDLGLVTAQTKLALARRRKKARMSVKTARQYFHGLWRLPTGKAPA